MARMNIYVPDDLKGRMDKVEGVNWSPLACRAFEAKLAEFISKKGPNNVQDVIARLKASRVKEAEDLNYEGREAGIAWAKQHAETSELEKLERIRSVRSEFLAEKWMEDGNGLAFITRDQIPTIIANRVLELPGEQYIMPGAERYWGAVSDCLYDQMENQSFLYGFVEGALEVWEQVKDQL